MSTPQDELIRRQRRAEMIRLTAGTNPNSAIRQNVDFGLLGEGDKPIGSWERPRTVNAMGAPQRIPMNTRPPLDIPNDQPMKYLSPRPDMIQNPAPAGPPVQWQQDIGGGNDEQGMAANVKSASQALDEYLTKRRLQSRPSYGDAPSRPGLDVA